MALSEGPSSPGPLAGLGAPLTTSAAQPLGDSTAGGEAAAGTATAAPEAATAAATGVGGLHPPDAWVTYTPDSLEDHEAGRHPVSLVSGASAVAARQRLLEQQQEERWSVLCSRCCSRFTKAAAAASRRSVECCATCRLRTPWGFLVHPSSFFLSLLHRYSIRYIKYISHSPHMLLCASLFVGGALVLLLLSALYFTFVADIPPGGPHPGPHSFQGPWGPPRPLTPQQILLLHSSSNNDSSSSNDSSSNNDSSSSSTFGSGGPLDDDGEGWGPWSLLQMPLLSGARLLQPSMSPLRDRTETLQRLFGPERQLTSILVVKQQQQQQRGAAAGGTGGDPKGNGLLQQETLKEIWSFTKALERETYKGAKWRDVCKQLNTDFALGGREYQEKGDI